MKKLISSFLTLITVMGMLSGVITFSSYAVEEFDDSSYVYTQLPGVQDLSAETMSTYNNEVTPKDSVI